MPARRIAILDDYSNVAPQYFQRINGLTIDTFPQTLDPSKPEHLEVLVAKLQQYEVISSMRERTPFPAELLSRLPNLKLLLNSSARNLAIDMQVASEHNIIVTGTKGDRPADAPPDRELPPPAGYSTVIQHAWALLLSLCSRIAEDDRALKTVPGAWQTGLMTALPGKTLGILGLGKLGVAFAKIGLQAFGMKVLAWSQNLTPEQADEAAVKVGLEPGTFEVADSLETMLRRADVVSLHNVLSDRSRGIIGAQALRTMKKSAVLLNTSRGGLIDEEALIEVLTEGGIKGFATDVFWKEPLPGESVWRKADTWAKSSTVLSPHMGYVNEGIISRWYEEQAEILQAWYDGKEVHNRLN